MVLHKNKEIAMTMIMAKIGLLPMAGENPTTLILGTLPGDDSLRIGEYYANPRNMFWDIMENVLGIPMHTDYETKCRILKKHGIALWDVFESAVRDGSLDTAITSEEYNDLESFINEHPTISKIVLNGGKAQKAFRKYRRLHPGMRRDVQVLPYTSTSRLSVTAGWTPERIVQQWKTMIIC